MALQRETKRFKRGRQRILLVRTCLDKFLCCFHAIKRKNLNDDLNTFESHQFPCKQGKPLAKPVLPHTESLAENTRALCKSGKSKVAIDDGLAHELRNSMVLFVNSAIITVFSLSNFRVIHQNPSSLSYYGDVTCQDESACALSPEPSAASIGQKAMLHIFSQDTGKLHRMLEDVRRGGVGKCWKGVIRVPPPGSLEAPKPPPAQSPGAREALAPDKDRVDMEAALPLDEGRGGIEAAEEGELGQLIRCRADAHISASPGEDGQKTPRGLHRPLSPSPPLLASGFSQEVADSKHVEAGMGPLEGLPLSLDTGGLCAAAVRGEYGIVPTASGAGTAVGGGFVSSNIMRSAGRTVGETSASHGLGGRGLEAASFPRRSLHLARLKALVLNLRRGDTGGGVGDISRRGHSRDRSEGSCGGGGPSDALTSASGGGSSGGSPLQCRPSDAASTSTSATPWLSPFPFLRTPTAVSRTSGGGGGAGGSEVNGRRHSLRRAAAAIIHDLLSHGSEPQDRVSCPNMRLGGAIRRGGTCSITNLGLRPSFGSSRHVAAADPASAAATATGFAVVHRMHNAPDSEEHIEEFSVRPRATMRLRQGEEVKSQARRQLMRTTTDVTEGLLPPRRGCSGMTSFSMSSTQLLWEKGTSGAVALNTSWRQAPSGMMMLQPGSQVLQPNDPLATSTFGLPLGPLQSFAPMSSLPAHLPRPLTFSSMLWGSPQAHNMTSGLGHSDVTHGGVGGSAISNILEFPPHPPTTASCSHNPVSSSVISPFTALYGRIATANHHPSLHHRSPPPPMPPPSSDPNGVTSNTTSLPTNFTSNSPFIGILSSTVDPLTNTASGTAWELHPQQPQPLQHSRPLAPVIPSPLSLSRLRDRSANNRIYRTSSAGALNGQLSSPPPLHPVHHQNIYPYNVYTHNLQDPKQQQLSFPWLTLESRPPELVTPSTRRGVTSGSGTDFMLVKLSTLATTATHGGTVPDRGSGNGTAVKESTANGRRLVMGRKAPPVALDALAAAGAIIGAGTTPACALTLGGAPSACRDSTLPAFVSSVTSSFGGGGGDGGIFCSPMASASGNTGTASDPHYMDISAPLHLADMLLPRIVRASHELPLVGPVFHQHHQRQQQQQEEGEEGGSGVGTSWGVAAQRGGVSIHSPQAITAVTNPCSDSVSMRRTMEGEAGGDVGGTGVETAAATASTTKMTPTTTIQTTVASAWLRGNGIDTDKADDGAAAHRNTTIASGRTDGLTLQLLTGLIATGTDSMQEKELCSGFSTVDGAEERDGEASGGSGGGTGDRGELSLERISEGTPSVASELGMTSSLGLCLGPAPASLGCSRPLFQVSAVSGDCYGAVPVLSSSSRFGQSIGSGGMVAPRAPTVDMRMDGVVGGEDDNSSHSPGAKACGGICRGAGERQRDCSTAVRFVEGGNGDGYGICGGGGGEKVLLKAPTLPPDSSHSVAVMEVPKDAVAAQAAAVQAAVGENWHEVWATRAVDPVTQEDVIILWQRDVTAKVCAERRVALAMETEHRLLEQLFPRHILQHITEDWTRKVATVLANPSPLPATPRPHPADRSRALSRRVSRHVGPGSFRWPPLSTDCSSLATWHEQVTLLYADIKGFTPMCKEVPPRAVMEMLNDLFSRWDALLGVYDVHKVETIGDCYFVAGGLFCHDRDGMVVVRDRASPVGRLRGSGVGGGNKPGTGRQPDPHHARRVFEFAKAMLAAASAVPLPTSGEPVQVRVGIHSGPVVSGVVGTRMPRFCLFGDTVNTTARLENTGMPGGIHVSDTTRKLMLADGLGEEEADDDEEDGRVDKEQGTEQRERNKQKGEEEAIGRLRAGDGGAWRATDGIEVRGKGRFETWMWQPQTT